MCEVKVVLGPIASKLLEEGFVSRPWLPFCHLFQLRCLIGGNLSADSFGLVVGEPVGDIGLELRVKWKSLDVVINQALLVEL